jgi:GPH family glycoside/pentoside/hexuronide:cation symporter
MKPNTLLSFKEKTGYALGDAASNFFFQFFGIFLMFYYTDVIGLPAAAVGTMMLVTRMFDAITDPLMGALADRTRTRWGRFRPWLLWMSIPYAVTGIAIFLCPANWGATGTLVYAYITYSAMMLIYTAINVPYSALMGVMSDSSTDRTRLASFRFVAAFGAGMLVSKFALPLKNILGGGTFSEAGNDKMGFLWTMSIFAVLSILCFLITFATTRERVQPVEDKKGSLRVDLSLLLRCAPWVLLFFVSLFNLTSFMIRNGAQIYYFKYVVGDEMAASNFMFCGFVAAMIGIALAPRITQLIGKRTAMIVLSTVSAAINGSFFFLSPDNYPLLLVMNVLGGLFGGPAGAIIWSMYADTADYIEWKHGRRMTGLVYAGVLFAIKMGVALGGGIIGWILAFFAFEANTTPSAQSLLGIRLAFAVVPAIFAFAAVFFLCGYRLKDSTVIEIEADLRQRRGEEPAPAAE